MPSLLPLYIFELFHYKNIILKAVLYFCSLIEGIENKQHLGFYNTVVVIKY